MKKPRNKPDPHAQPYPQTALEMSARERNILRKFEAVRRSKDNETNN